MPARLRVAGLIQPFQTFTTTVQNISKAAVVLGNTLTGEFSRANTLRLRWPYVRRVVRKVLEENACPSEHQRELLAEQRPQGGLPAGQPQAPSQD